MAPVDPPTNPTSVPGGCGRSASLIMLLLILALVAVFAIWAWRGSDTPAPNATGTPPVQQP